MAKSLNLRADLISDDWLLPPETTETAKRLTALEAENSRLRAAEPSFSIHCTNQSDAAVDCYSASYTWFEPLTDAEVNGLMQRLKVRFPLATDFRSREPTERSVPRTVASRVFSGPQIFIPATDESRQEDTHALGSENSHPASLLCCFGAEIDGVPNKWTEWVPSRVPYTKVSG